MSEQNKPPRFTRSYDVQQIIERLSKCAIGERVPYAELLAILGQVKRDGNFYAKLRSARRALQNDSQVVFFPEGDCLIRANDAGIVKGGSAYLVKIRNSSKRGIKLLGCVDYDKLTSAEKAKHDATASHLGILAECSKAKIVERITDKATEKQAKLTFDETPDAFRGKREKKSTT